ncbi:MAG TPA: sulfatase [Gaiellaceae bacterium]|nr:sulfatase [Gaiellaceae bacterium]
MGRGRWIVAAAVVVSAAVVAAAGAAGARPDRVPARHAARLNVVLILSDDERLDGDDVMRNVHRLLMHHGVTFDDYHVTTSLCGPSRASILTGDYSHHTGVLTNFGPHGYPAFDPRADLPVWLHRAGYTTALVGKYLNDYTLDGHGAIPPGWDDWQVMDSVPEEAYYDYSLDENGRIVHYGAAPSDYSTTVLTQKATAFIHRARAPFFLYFAPVAPHLPAIPAPQDRGKLEDLAPLHSPDYDEQDLGDKPWAAWHPGLLSAAARLYGDRVRVHQLESLLALDRSVGSIVAALRAKGVLDRTVILYTSDNGFLWGEHRLGGKLWPYEESTHVPLVVRTPWTAANGTVNDEPVLNVDLAPTIAQLAHVEPGRPVDGRSFAPFLHGAATPWRRAYLLEYLGRSQLRAGGPPPYVAVHTARYVWIEYRNGWRELYDLRRDPWELDNIARSPATAALRRSLHALLVRLDSAAPRAA